MSRKPPRNIRIEKDSLGSVELPQDVYYGMYTARVLDNFTISGRKVPELFLHTYIRVKKCYALVNKVQNKLEPQLADAIVTACDMLLQKEKESFLQYFPIDSIQSGGGTSTNMMVNEVIANLANELLGSKKGIYTPIHPNDHVNMSQSSNDTFPGVIKVCALIQIESLFTEVDAAIAVCKQKAQEFGSIEKVGRTHLQDAVRMQLGDEFAAFVVTLEKNKRNLQHAQEIASELPFGATALGSLQNITPEIRENIIKQSGKEFNQKFNKPTSYFEATSSSGDFAKISSALSNFSADMIKIANDLRLLASGPRAGLNELYLPEVQAGSSIMPGKVNPSILEGMTMACFTVMGNHHTIELATTHAQLQLQPFMPVIGFTLHDSFVLLINSMRTFREKCLIGIQANEEEITKHLTRSFVAATEYAEVLGYAKVAELVKKAYGEDIPIRDLIQEELDKKNPNTKIRNPKQIQNIK